MSSVLSSLRQFVRATHGSSKRQLTCAFHTAPMVLPPVTDSSCRTVRVDVDTLHLIDAATRQCTASIPTRWLLDHCRCARCYNAATLQRSSEPHTWSPHAPTVRQAVVDGDELRIEWNSAVDHQHEHSVFDMSMLANIHELCNMRTQRPHVQHLWSDGTMLNSVPRVSYTQLMSPDGNRRERANFYSKLFETGLCIVSGTPPSEHDTIALCGQLGRRMHTHWGDWWCISVEHGAQTLGMLDTAYTQLALSVHNDGTYFHEAPGVQVFHMTTPATEGGETLLADGFAAAERLRLENKHHFDVLSRYLIAHEYRDGGKEHCHTVDTVIRLDNDGNVETIRFNPYDRAPMKPSPEYTFDQFYAAYAHLARLLANPTSQMCLSLKAGECLFVDNHRVLHGRRAFTLAPGTARTMVGCYLTRDSVVSQARVHNVW